MEAPDQAMPALSSSVQLIVNADDFGLSTAHNQAVLRAHRQGILTSASLMVNGAACAEAVQIARANPNLGVGLHLTLVCGQSTLDASAIPDLVDAGRNFSSSPVCAGFRYYFLSKLKLQISHEIQAQFDKFMETGLVLDHINGHLNIHLHPAVLPALIHSSSATLRTGFRLTRDPLGLNLKLGSGRCGYRLSHALIFGCLSRWARSRLPSIWVHTQAVFGLLENARITESYIESLLPRLGPGCYELYSHPTVRDPAEELAALLSPQVGAMVKRLGIRLLRYQDIGHV